MLSLSRVFILVVAIVSFFELLNFKNLTIRRICLSILYLSRPHIFVWLFRFQMEPVRSLSDSGGARAEEYDIARLLLQVNGCTHGIPPTTVDRYVTGNEFFPQLPISERFGIWFDWGSIGFALFAVGCHIIMRDLPGTGQFQRPLFLTGAFLVAYSVLAPLPFYPSGAIYFAALLSLWLSGRRLLERKLVIKRTNILVFCAFYLHYCSRTRSIR